MPNQAPSPLVNFLPIIFIFLIFYFLVIKPQKKQQAEHKSMIANLNKNDEVVTIGGVHGTIVNIKEKTFILRVDDNTRMEVDKNAISYLIKKQ